MARNWAESWLARTVPAPTGFKYGDLVSIDTDGQLGLVTHDPRYCRASLLKLQKRPKYAVGDKLRWQCSDSTYNDKHAGEVLEVSFNRKFEYKLLFRDLPIDGVPMTTTYHEDYLVPFDSPLPGSKQPTKETKMNDTDTAKISFFRAASKALLAVAKASAEFTTDQLWALIPAEARQGIEPRALGGFMRESARKGLIRATDRTVKSARKECHKRPLRVWISLK